MGDLRKSKRDDLLPTAVELHRHGKSNAQIAKSLNISTKSITRWFKEVDLEEYKETTTEEVEPTLHTMVWLTNEVFKGYVLQETQRLEGLREWRGAIAICQILFGASHMRDRNMPPKERQETNNKLAAIAQGYIESGVPKAIEIGNTLFDIYFKGLDPNSYYQGRGVAEEDFKSFYEASEHYFEYIEGFYRNTFGAV